MTHHDTTIVFTDIRGSTELIERLGDVAWIRVLRDHNAIVRELVAAHGGVEVKFHGDGFMLVFSHAGDAVRCATAIQLAFDEYSKVNPQAPLSVRIGIHSGRALRDGDDFIGKDVCVASRIAASADGGEILVSARARDELRSSVRALAERDLHLKGLSGIHRVYAVDWEPRVAEALEPEPAAAAQPAYA